VGEATLVVRAGTHLCAFELAHIVEVMRPLPIRPIAGTPHFVSGVAVIRGESTPVVDLARLLSGVARPVQRFVTLAGGRYAAALAVEEVVGVCPVDEWHELSPVLDVVDEQVIEALGTFDAQPLLMLDAGRIVAAAEVAVG
jgi:purine-binding chemotaxis protein CheW